MQLCYCCCFLKGKYNVGEAAFTSVRMYAHFCICVCMCVCCISWPVQRSKVTGCNSLPFPITSEAYKRQARHSFCHFQQKLFAQKTAERPHQFRYLSDEPRRLELPNQLNVFCHTFSTLDAAVLLHFPLSAQHTITYQSSSSDEVTLLKATEYITHIKYVIREPGVALSASTSFVTNRRGRAV